MFACRLNSPPHITGCWIDSRIALEPDSAQRVMVVNPRRVERLVSPGWALSDDDARLELVIGKHALPLLGLLQDQDQIGEVRNDLAFLIENDPISPIRRLAPPQRRFASFLQVGKTILEDQLEAIF